MIKTFPMENYCIERLDCRCSSCGNVFSGYAPSGSELVCFEDNLGNRHFLKTYGDYGYLYLMEKLGCSAALPITPQTVAEFESKLSRITAAPVSLLKRERCPSCGSEEATVTKRELLPNHPVSWLGIDIDGFDNNN